MQSFFMSESRSFPGKENPGKTKGMQNTNTHSPSALKLFSCLSGRAKGQVGLARRPARIIASRELLFLGEVRHISSVVSLADLDRLEPCERSPSLVLNIYRGGLASVLLWVSLVCEELPDGVSNWLFALSRCSLGELSLCVHAGNNSCCCFTLQRVFI